MTARLVWHCPRSKESARAGQQPGPGRCPPIADSHQSRRPCTGAGENPTATTEAKHHIPSMEDEGALVERKRPQATPAQAGTMAPRRGCTPKRAWCGRRCLLCIPFSVCSSPLCTNSVHPPLRPPHAASFLIAFLLSLLRHPLSPPCPPPLGLGVASQFFGFAQLGSAWLGWAASPGASRIGAA